MNALKTRPLMLAAGIGFAIQVGLNLLVTLPVLFLSLQPNLLEKFIVEDMGQPNTGIVMALLGVGALACFVPFFVDAGVGALYANLHHRIDAIELQDGILGGAASAALGRIGARVVSTGISLLITPFLMSRMFTDLGPMPGGVSPVMPVSFTATMMVSGVVGGVMGILWGAILGAMGGGIGGGIMGAILERRADRAAYS